VRQGFRTCAAWGLAIITAGWSCNLNAAEPLRLILIVNDEVRLPAQLLQDAREVAARIFRHADVDIVWFAAHDAIPQEPAATKTTIRRGTRSRNSAAV